MLPAANPTPPLGFTRTPSPPSAPAVSKPTPLPKRPKGRWFLGALLLAACAYGGYHVWDSFFRYKAYGTVTGHVIQVGAPWDGVVAHWHVREGESVRQGQPLVTLENLTLRHRMAQVDDELKTTQATLEAEAVKLKWQAAFHLDQPTGSTARYFELWGQLAQEEKQHERLRKELDAAEALARDNAVPRIELERLRCDTDGQREKVAKLRRALDEQRKQADLTVALLTDTGDLAGGLKADGQDQLKPHLARIAALRAERARLQEQMDAGRIVAPANGLVVKTHRLAAEHCKSGEPLVSFLEEGTLQVVLYVPQRASGDLAVGSDVELAVDPYPGRLAGKVERVGDRYEPAPESIKRHYSAGEALLPVYVRPAPESAQWMALRVDGVVKMP